MSYLRDERIDANGLPSIRTSMRAWEAPQPRRVYEDSLLDDRLKYTNGYTRDRDVLYQPRPPSPGAHSKRHIDATNDQIKFYKDEIAKKDRLISQLTSMETPRPRLIDSRVPLDDFYSSDNITTMSTIKSEHAAQKIRLDTLQSQLRETQAQLEVREDKIKELRLQLESFKEGESRQSSIVHSLRQKMAEYELQNGSIEGAASRSELAIASLQTECSSYQNRILELETRLKQNLDERERAEQDQALYKGRYSEIVSQIQSLCHIDGYTDVWTISPEVVIARLKDTVSENAMLRGKIETMKEHCHSAELESKASRETIMRLVTEAEREQKSVNRFSMDMEGLRLERDTAMDRQREFEREIELLRERVDASQRALNATKRELDEKESRFMSADRELRDRSLVVRNVETQYMNFKETLAGLLSDSLHTIDPSEDMIRDRLTNLTLAVRDKTAHIDMLEAKLNDLSKQLESTYDQSRNAERKSKRMEADFLDIEDRLRKYEGEMAAGDMLRDGLRCDKERYMRFLERIVHAMKMEAITMDLGVESITDAIIARSEQLVRMDADSISGQKTHIYNLQRKVKTMKEQLDSKELHMELLRKKMAAYEERVIGKTDLERQKEEEFVKCRKLTKLVDRYKREINEARMEIRDLKARLLESSDIRSRTMEQEREIENLESKVGQLETVRQRQANKLIGLKSNLDETLGEFSSKKNQSSNTIQALSSELRTTKMALDEQTKKERQLLDLRQVIARMLGMDVNSLAVPDYEIIARLEKLILANQANVSTAVALDTALLDMGEGFRAGYEDASRSLTATSRSRPPGGKRSHLNLRTRPRSASPGRRRDTRAY